MSMKVVQNKTFDAEREFYESSDIVIKNCTFVFKPLAGIKANAVEP